MTTASPDVLASVYAAEARAWSALEGHLPSMPHHDPALWIEWLAAVRLANSLSGPGDMKPAATRRRASPALSS